MKSTTLPIYKKWLATATVDEIEKVDAIYAACEQHYEQGGHWVVETHEPADILKLGSVEAARQLANLKTDLAKDARWGEDSDPELSAKKWESELEEEQRLNRER
jgi:hypothetical protein